MTLGTLLAALKGLEATHGADCLVAVSDGSSVCGVSGVAGCWHDGLVVTVGGEDVKVERCVVLDVT